MGPRSITMSDNDNFLSNNNLPSNVEEDRPLYGNFCSSTTRLINNYTQQGPHAINNYTQQGPHAIAIGGSTFSRPTPHTPQQRQRTFDIAPTVNPYEGYKDERKRLQTFSDWPSHIPVKKEDLARNGFIYLHVSDRTQCVFCRGILSNWETGDVVENEHKRTCPECPLAFGYECGNKPILRQTVPEVQRRPQQNQPATFNTTVNIPAQPANSYQHTYHIVPQNVTSNEDVGRSIDLDPGNRADAQGHSLPSIPSQQSLSSVNTSRSEPKYPQWADFNLRLRSYMGWPAQMSQKPRDLAAAGLLYMAKGDRCKCFSCGGELYDWEPQDDPMEEHAKWFSECSYLRSVKGDAYIQYVKDKQNGLIVEPSEMMSKPHVLAVLQSGYTTEQIEEVVRRYGAPRLLNASDIIKAIEETNRERQSRLQQMNTHNSIQHTPQSQPQSSDDSSMEIELEPEPQNQTAVKSTSPAESPSLETRTRSPTAAPATEIKDKDVDRVLLENEKLKDQRLCKICMDRDLCVMYLPCNHLVTCAECSDNLDECPICRKKILQKMRVFWS